MILKEKQQNKISDKFHAIFETLNPRTGLLYNLERSFDDYVSYFQKKLLTSDFRETNPKMIFICKSDIFKTIS